jgi:hypothetical protein
MNQQILWKLLLNDGTEIWSDFDLENKKDPWTRARHYCNNNNKNIVQVKVIIPGNPEQLVWENSNGLDNILIVRGMAKDINDSGETVYSFMTFGKVEEDELIHVKRFYWPECKFGTTEEIREITPENEKLLYRKIKRCSDDCTCQSKEQI